MARTDNIKAEMHAGVRTSKPAKKYSQQFFNTNIEEHRKIVALAKPNSPAANVDCVEEIIELGSDIKLLTRRFTPRGQKKEKMPTLFYIDGTAWVADGGEFSRWISGHLSYETGFQVIELHTLLAPEHSILKSKQYAYRLFRHFYDRAGEYGIAREHISIAGYSSGGNIADYIDTRGNRDGIHITQKVLISPFVELSDSIENTKKYRQWGKYAELDRQISKKFIRYWRDVAVPENDRRKPCISPFFERRPSKKTPTHLILGEFDRLRAQIEAFYDIRKEQGIEIDKYVIKDGNHAGFWRLLAEIKLAAALVKLPVSKGEYSVRLYEDDSFEIMSPPQRLSS